MLLRKVFWPKRKETTGGGIKLRNEELNDFYCMSYIVRVITPRGMRWDWPVARMREKRNIFSILVGKPEGKRPLMIP